MTEEGFNTGQLILGIAVTGVVCILCSVILTALFFTYGDRRRRGSHNRPLTDRATAFANDKLDSVVVETYDPADQSERSEKSRLRFIKRDLDEKLDFNISQKSNGEFSICDLTACERLQPEIIPGDELVSCVIEFSGLALPLAKALLQSTACNISQICVRRRPPVVLNIPTITVTDCSGGAHKDTQQPKALSEHPDKSAKESPTNPNHISS